MTVQEDVRDATFELLVKWNQSMPESFRINLDEEQKMNWDQNYERWKRKLIAAGVAEGKAEGRTEGIAEGRTEGIAEGKANAILVVLEARGLTVSAAQIEQILHCQDIAQLDAWMRAAVTTADVAEMLAVPPQPRTRPRSPKRAA